MHHVISFVWEWDELDNLQLQEFFRGGTFLEGRVTYGGVDSGAICKEPVQAMVSHHHPQSLSWKITLKYGKRSFVAFVTTYSAESDRSLQLGGGLTQLFQSWNYSTSGIRCGYI